MSMTGITNLIRPHDFLKFFNSKSIDWTIFEWNWCWASRYDMERLEGGYMTLAYDFSKLVKEDLTF